MLARACTELVDARTWLAIGRIEPATCCTELVSRPIAGTARPEATSMHPQTS
jgi:hypothetical protein